jgi:hypothetical protein
MGSQARLRNSLAGQGVAARVETSDRGADDRFLVQPNREVSMYRAFGYAHAALHRTLSSTRAARGQGTVEYVALILLVALVMAGVVAAMKGFKTDEGQALGDVILSKIKQAVRRVQF